MFAEVELFKLWKEIEKSLSNPEFTASEDFEEIFKIISLTFMPVIVNSSSESSPPSSFFKPFEKFEASLKEKLITTDFKIPEKSAEHDEKYVSSPYRIGAEDQKDQIRSFIKANAVNPLQENFDKPQIVQEKPIREILPIPPPEEGNIPLSKTVHESLSIRQGKPVSEYRVPIKENFPAFSSEEIKPETTQKELPSEDFTKYEYQQIEIRSNRKIPLFTKHGVNSQLGYTKEKAEKVFGQKITRVSSKETVENPPVQDPPHPRGEVRLPAYLSPFKEKPSVGKNFTFAQNRESTKSSTLSDREAFFQVGDISFPNSSSEKETQEVQFVERREINHLGVPKREVKRLDLRFESAHMRFIFQKDNMSVNVKLKESWEFPVSYLEVKRLYKTLQDLGINLEALRINGNDLIVKTVKTIRREEKDRGNIREDELSSEKTSRSSADSSSFNLFL